MSHVKMLTIGDVHIADNPPGKRTETFCSDVLTKLRECSEIAERESVTHILYLGDIFHLKHAHRISHRLVQDMSKIILDTGLPTYILVGNHDITDGSLDSLAKQPIGTLGLLSNVTLLTWDPVQLDEDITLHPIPGVHPKNAPIEKFAVGGDSKQDILVVHQGVVPDVSKENENYRDQCYDAADIDYASKCGLVLYGHHHRYDGIYTVGDTTFSNLGSITRLEASDHDLHKMPRVLTVDFDDGPERLPTLTEHRLENVRHYEEAYSLADHYEAKEHQLDIDETISKLKETRLGKFSLESIEKHIQHRDDVDDEVKTCSVNLIEAVK